MYIIFSTVTVSCQKWLRTYMVIIPFFTYGQFLSPVPHRANLTVSTNKPFNLTCLGAYYSPAASEQVVWDHPQPPPSDFPPFVIPSTMPTVLVFEETMQSISGRYACRSLDTAELLSDYFVTFMPGENCLDNYVSNE